MKKMDELNELNGKKIYVEVKSGRRYTGKVIAVEDDFLKIIDKFDSKVYIKKEEINVLEEVGE